MKNDFKSKIFSKIKEEKIKPLPVSYFVNKQRILWFMIGILLLFAMLFGGFFLDDTIEFFGMRWYNGWNPSFFILPNIFWLGLIVLLTFIGIQKLRDTPTGHRHSYLQDILIGIIIIFIGSYIVRGIGVGPRLHSVLIDTVPTVSSILYNESAWNNPDNGRLAGTIEDIRSQNITLRSLDGNIWNVDIQQCNISPMVSLVKGEKIRILGNKNTDNYFEAVTIMPWFGRWMGMGWWYGKNHGMYGY